MMDELRELIERLRDYGNRDEPGICEHAADEIERLMRENERLARISLAARRLDRAICEFGLKPPFVAEAAQSLHDLLHGSTCSASGES